MTDIEAAIRGCQADAAGALEAVSGRPGQYLPPGDEVTHLVELDG
jgi:hypothetical protein